MESTIFLNNISCSGCVNTVKSSISNISGAIIKEVDIPTGKVTLLHDDPSILNEILEIWDEAGYSEK